MKAKPKKKPARSVKPQACAPVVRTHDGGHTWEAACPCGLRTPAYTRKEYADQAAKAHGDNQR